MRREATARGKTDGKVAGNNRAKSTGGLLLDTPEYDAFPLWSSLPSSYRRHVARSPLFSLRSLVQQAAGCVWLSFVFAWVGRASSVVHE